jgi:hypothetical protein
MCDSNLTDSAPACNTVNSAIANTTPPPSYADLICPRCYHEASLSSPPSRISCSTCGWLHTLDTEEGETLEDALHGIGDLNTQVYLQVLAAQDAPIPADAYVVAA